MKKMSRVREVDNENRKVPKLMKMGRSNEMRRQLTMIPSDPDKLIHCVRTLDT